MGPTKLPGLWKAVRHDPANLLAPLRHPRSFSQGIYLFNGNRLVRHRSARIEKAGGRVQFGCFWEHWRQRGGIVLHADACLRIGGPLVIGDGVIIEVHRGACLEIGAETFINPNARIIVLESVRIGRGCAVAWDVQIMDSDRHYLLDANGAPRKNSAPIEIGDRVWIGARSLVLKGARIEEGVVVGAGSVVTGRLAAHGAYAGNPARRLRDGVRWER